VRLLFSEAIPSLASLSDDLDRYSFKMSKRSEDMNHSQEQLQVMIDTIPLVSARRHPGIPQPALARLHRSINRTSAGLGLEGHNSSGRFRKADGHVARPALFR
jgi:hypothetical protein